jgi:maltokinase
MLQSLDHVARVIIRRTGQLSGAATSTVLGWIPLAQQAFLVAYRGELSGAGQRQLLVDEVLWPLRLWQECREFSYAEQHLPHWRYVPDAALAALLPEQL